MKKLFTFLSVVLYTSAYAQPFNEYTKNWATYFGGEGTRLIYSALDVEGNFIVAGPILGGTLQALQNENYYNQFITTQSSNFLYNANLVQNSNSNQSIIAKFSPQGTLLQAVYVPFEIFNLKIDLTNNLYISGSSRLTNLATPNAWFTSPSNPGLVYGILVKLNSDFTTNWLTYLPTDSNTKICLDENFNIYGASHSYIA